MGGRIYERTPGGVEHDWGEVTVWSPPARLAYLWHLRRDRADATEVEIRFTATGSGATRVEIEHRGWERLGSAAAPVEPRGGGVGRGAAPAALTATSERPLTVRPGRQANPNRFVVIPRRMPRWLPWS